jgi:hypothetical protein
MPDTRRKHYEYDPNLSGTLTPRTSANTNTSQQAVADNNDIAHVFLTITKRLLQGSQEDSFLLFYGHHVM